MLFNIEFSFSEVLIVLAILILISIGIILALRYTILYNQKRIKTQRKTLLYTANRTKYQAVNSFKYSNILLKYGLVIALLFSLTIISWTRLEKTVYTINSGELFDDPIMEIDPPRVYFPKPPPPPPIIVPIIDDLVETIDDTPDLISDKVEITLEPTDIIDTTTVQDTSDYKVDPRIEIFKKPEEKFIEEPIISIAEQMPRFPGCEGDMTKKEKEKCAVNKLLAFIYDHIKYPVIAKENGIEGIVVLNFVVDKSGAIDQIKILKDIGGGCGKESLKAVKAMQTMDRKWTPGKQHGVAVKVRYTLPIKFELK